jgi:hypothetical protein
MKNIHLFFAFFSLSTFAFTQSTMVFQDWITTEGTQHYFMQAAVATDPYGGTYLAGATLNSSGDYDILVTKIASTGEVAWTDQYDGTGHGDDAAIAITVDAHCNLYLTGSVFSSSTDSNDVVTMHYDSSGTQQWVQVYSGADNLFDAGTCLLLDGSNLFIGGVETDDTDNEDFLVLNYNTSGTLAWSNTYDESGMADLCTRIAIVDKKITLFGGSQTSAVTWDLLATKFNRTNGAYSSSSTISGGAAAFTHVRSLDRDTDGNIYLTGTKYNGGTGFDVYTVVLDSDLTVVWDATYNSSGAFAEFGNAIALDASGNVYVSGWTDSTGRGTDYLTIKYNDSGTQQWVRKWGGTSLGADSANALIVDGDGDILVTGTSWNGSSLDCHTLKYSPAGALLWQTTFNDKYNYDDRAFDIALAADGNVVVAGQIMNPDSSWSYIALKYLERILVPLNDPEDLSPALRFWENRDQLLDVDSQLVERVRYYTGQSYPDVYLMEDSVSFVFSRVDSDSTTEDTLHRVDMNFGNTGHKLLPIGKEAYHNNYYLGISRRADHWFLHSKQCRSRMHGKAWTSNITATREASSLP